MTTISHRRRNKIPVTPTIAVALLLIVLVTTITIWKTQAGSVFWMLVAPVVSLRNEFDATESAALRAELASTTAMLADRNALEQENLLLKSRFGRDATVQVVLASVLMRPPGTPYDTLVIDAGAQEGVIQGALVSAGGNSYIGTVSDVYTTTSRVTLFSAPSATYNALVLLSADGGKSVPISLTGEGAGSMSAEVPSATAVSIGDTVVVPGISLAFAGTVSHIEQPEGESFETLYVHLPVDIFSLQFVEVRLPTPK